MNDDPPVILKSSAEIERMEGQAAPHWRPVYHAVRRHGIALGGIIQSRKPFRMPRHMPTLLWVGDDVDTSLGPTAFHAKSLRRFVERCCYGVVVACSPETVFYSTAAATAAAIRQDVVLVETRPEHEGDWVDRLRQIQPKLPLLIGMLQPPSEARH